MLNWNWSSGTEPFSQELGQQLWADYQVARYSLCCSPLVAVVIMITSPSRNRFDSVRHLSLVASLVKLTGSDKDSNGVMMSSLFTLYKEVWSHSSFKTVMLETDKKSEKGSKHMCKFTCVFTLCSLCLPFLSLQRFWLIYWLPLLNDVLVCCRTVITTAFCWGLTQPHWVEQVREVEKGW